jgi:hypothetical protein
MEKRASRAYRIHETVRGPIEDGVLHLAGLTARIALTAYLAERSRALLSESRELLERLTTLTPTPEG